MPDYSQQDDHELVRMAQEDYAAFSTLYRRHVTAIYRFCIMRTQNTTDAEDVTAQTFLAALESLDRYAERGTVLGWLFGIARHKCADLHRSRRRLVDTPWQTVTNDEMGSTNPTPQPEEAAHRALLLDCIERMLPQLSEDRQEAIQLRYYGGLALQEVAQAMARSLAAVKMLISRGLTDLRKRCHYETL